MSEKFAIPTKDELAGLPQADLINAANDEHLQVLLRKHKINAEEYQNLKSIMGREPTFAELGVFSSMWSEHCSYKSSRVHLSRFLTTGEQVVQGPGENAGVVRLDGKLCAAFKMESHNHPSYLEPYQGAATGVGGILRDVFCMGARPVANLNALRFGSHEHPRTHYLVRNVVKGIGDYGNCVGIPTVGGNISFDKTYDGNCLVNAMTVGLIDDDAIFKGYATGTGNLVIYVGSATGRDGIHGATMASDSFASQQSEERSAVQVGDPFMEKLLMEATLEVLAKGLVVGLQDMGAAGLTSSSFEMADRAGTGLYLDLNKVPVRTESMTAYELLLSESQERMLMVVEPHQWSKLVEVFEKWQLAYAVIGAVTESGRVQGVFDGKLEIDIPVSPITESAPKYERPIAPTAKLSVAQVQEYEQHVSELVEHHGTANVLQQIFADVGDKAPVFWQYDRHIGTKTVLSSDHDGAAVLWLQEAAKERGLNEFLGLGISTACNERQCAVDAKIGGALAVLKCARMLIAAGSEPLAITDCLNFGNPEVPEIMGQFSSAVDGITEACTKLNTPVVSGNVSLYNETDGQSIAPTPMIGMVGRSKDVRKARPAVLGARVAKLYWLSPVETAFTWSGSIVGKLNDLEPTGQLPAIDWDFELHARDLLLRDQVELLACREVGDGGVFTAALKMCLRDDVTVDLSVWALDEGQGLADTTGYLLAVDPAKDAELRTQVGGKGLVLRPVAEVNAGGASVRRGGNELLSIVELRRAWQRATGLARPYSEGLI